MIRNSLLTIWMTREIAVQERCLQIRELLVTFCHANKRNPHFWIGGPARARAGQRLIDCF